MTIFTKYLLIQLPLLKSVDKNYIGSFQLTFTGIILPIYLLSINSFINKKFNFNGNHLVHFVLISFCILISAHFDLENWRTNRNPNINAENRDVIEFGLYLISFLGLITSLIGVILKSKKQKNVSSIKSCE